MNNKTKSKRYTISSEFEDISSIQQWLGIQTTKNRKAIEKLDLLLLAIEAVDINASVSLTKIFHLVFISAIYSSLLINLGVSSFSSGVSVISP